ncbi:MAG TPA: SDR family NAD(P)-dependent oxidoreductase, partial [Cyclobacteriaceae bacterium]|nr:SDR family NAD(P)-dependent oxidoreductase [Cyclobacteriaceae bacterium]
ATSGIGEATALLLAENNFRLILCGRRKDRLEALKIKLTSLTDIHTLAFDVRDEEAVKRVFSGLPESWKKIDVLINSAGNAHGLDPIQTGKVADWNAMIDINIKGLLYVCHEVIPGMAERKTGHVVNIGSIAGKEVYPNSNVYSASKFAVDALTRGMRIDLNANGIKVTAINPGMVETEFSLVRFKGDAERAALTYKGLDPLKGKDIADIILYTITRPAHVMLADITVFPTAQASSMHVKRDA